MTTEVEPKTLGQLLAEQAEALLERRRARGCGSEWSASLLQRTTGFAAADDRYRRALQAGSRMAERDEFIDDEEVPIGPGVMSRLKAEVGPEAKALQAHDGPLADQLARGHDADAVTIDNDVFFRDGAFTPHTREGLALLRHEAHHVVEHASASADFRRTSPRGRLDEERRAHQTEWRSLGQPATQISKEARRPTPEVAALEPQRSSSSAPAVMTAGADRPGPVPMQHDTGPDLAQISDAMRRDLMDQIRSDFERGG